MIVDIALIALSAAALAQPTSTRRLIGAAFLMITLVHEWKFSDLEGIQYFGSAALFDLAIIMLLSGIRPVPKLVLYLQGICVASILTNLMGWVAWVLYLELDVYNDAMGVLYLCAIVALLHRDRADERMDFAGYSGRPIFRFNIY